MTDTLEQVIERLLETGAALAQEVTDLADEIVSPSGDEENVRYLRDQVAQWETAFAAGEEILEALAARGRA